MKISTYIFTLALLGQSQGMSLRRSKDSRRRLETNDDIDEIVFTTETGECNFEVLEEALAEECSGCDLVELLVGANGNKRLAKMKVKTLCEDAIANNDDPNKNALHFDRITEQGFQFDKEFFDGGTALNAEYDPDAIEDSRGGANIEDVYNDVAQDQLITYPDYIGDLLSKNCNSRAVMCCWVQDRQAGDNNGNCNAGDCIDKDPADNTDVCYVDLATSKRSNHVHGGFALFPGDTATTGEGDAHCHGFTWSSDKDAPDYRYRGNALFYVSMYDHLNNRGYVRNVPGAPMCSSIDKSPTVSRSDCTNVEVEETFVFTRLRRNGNGNGRAKLIKSAYIEDVNINFNNCPTDDGQNNDLGRWYDQEERSDGEPSRSDIIFDQHIVEDCDDGDHYENFLAKKGYKLKD